MLVPHREDRRARRSRRIALQCAPEGCEGETVAGVLTQDAEARQRPHESMQRARIGAGDSRQLAGRSRTISKMVGETHVGRGADKLGHRIRRAHLNDLYVRREH
jgi:hypothetical protein